MSGPSVIVGHAGSSGQSLVWTWLFLPHGRGSFVPKIADGSLWFAIPDPYRVGIPLA